MPRRINKAKIHFLLLQGTAYILLGLASFIWSKYSKGVWKYVNLFFGIAFLIWGVFDLFYAGYLLYHKPLIVDDIQIVGSNLV